MFASTVNVTLEPGVSVNVSVLLSACIVVPPATIVLNASLPAEVFVFVIVIVSVEAFVEILIPVPAAIFYVSPAWSATTFDCPDTANVLKAISCVTGVLQDIFPKPSVVSI